MNAFNIDHFTRRLIEETLFYDDEYGALANLSLVDLDKQQERFIAYFVPDDGNFMIEEAIEWEEFDAADDADEIGYALAVDSKEHACFDNVEEAAQAVLTLAQQHNLAPSITLLFEEDDVA
jgi:sugar/nucleoside kinase (ribokinase family)